MTTVIVGLLVIAAGTIVVAFGVREVRQLLYVREVRHMPILTECQARENAAPLSCAVVHHREEVG